MILNPRTLFSVFATKVNNLWHHEVHRLRRDMENMKAEAKFEEQEQSRLEGEALLPHPQPAMADAQHCFKPFAHRQM